MNRLIELLNEIETEFQKYKEMPETEKDDFWIKMAINNMRRELEKEG